MKPESPEKREGFIPTTFVLSGILSIKHSSPLLEYAVQALLVQVYGKYQVCQNSGWNSGMSFLI